MEILSNSDIDRELASWTDQVGELSTTLVDIDNHPGLQHVRAYPPVGATADRWAGIEMTLARLWEDLASVTSTLQSAQGVRGRRSKLNDDDRASLTRMLESGGLADTTRASCADVTEFLDAVDAINTRVAEGIAPLLKQLDDAGASAPSEITDLLTVSATDPLSMTARDVDNRIATLAELVTLQANWPDAITATQGRLDDLRTATQQARQARIDAERVVIATFESAPDTEPELRAELVAITQPDPAALRSLQARIESALEMIQHHDELATGLLDRRAELQGRLKAYEAKAARLGLAEDPELLSSHQIAAGLLSRRPCELKAVTRAVADYQQLISDKRGALR